MLMPVERMGEWMMNFLRVLLVYRYELCSSPVREIEASDGILRGDPYVHALYLQFFICLFVLIHCIPLLFCMNTIPIDAFSCPSTICPATICL